jgi:hypothetical protein
VCIAIIQRISVEVGHRGQRGPIVGETTRLPRMAPFEAGPTLAARTRIAQSGLG